MDLLKVKWNSFVKRTFYTHFLIFALYFLLSSCCFVMRGTTPNAEDAGNCTLGLVENVTDIIQPSLSRENLLLENNLTGTSGSQDLFSTAMADLQNYNYLELNPDNNETLGECTEETTLNACFHNTYDVLDKQVGTVFFSTLIGRGPMRLESHWSRASECCWRQQSYSIKNIQRPNLPCMERSFYRRPYAIKNQCRASKKYP